MKKAIGISVQPYEQDGILHSHFFGAPALPEAWLGDFDIDTLFLAMFNLEEVRPFDKENRLPASGYLYIFIDISQTQYHMRPIVRYSKQTPTHIVDDFNNYLSLETNQKLNKPLGMSFVSINEDAGGHKLLGVPYDWNYETKPKELLLTISHLDDELGFFNALDGFSYIFFGPKENEFDEATLFSEIS